MKLVTIFLIRMFPVNLTQIAPVVRAFGIHTLVDPETGTVLNRYKYMSAVRTSVVNRLCVYFTAYECGSTDLALVLTFTTVVIVKILMRSAADRAEFIIRHLMTAAAFDRL